MIESRYWAHSTHEHLRFKILMTGGPLCGHMFLRNMLHGRLWVEKRFITFITCKRKIRCFWTFWSWVAWRSCSLPLLCRFENWSQRWARSHRLGLRDGYNLRIQSKVWCGNHWVYETTTIQSFFHWSPDDRGGTRNICYRRWCTASWTCPYRGVLAQYTNVPQIIVFLGSGISLIHRIGAKYLIMFFKTGSWLNFPKFL